MKIMLYFCGVEPCCPILACGEMTKNYSDMKQSYLDIIDKIEEIPMTLNESGPTVMSTIEVPISIPVNSHYDESLLRDKLSAYAHVLLLMNEYKMNDNKKEINHKPLSLAEAKNMLYGFAPKSTHTVPANINGMRDEANAKYL